MWFGVGRGDETGLKQSKTKAQKKLAFFTFHKQAILVLKGRPCEEMYKCRLLATQSMSTSGEALLERVVQENGGGRRECQQCSLEKCSFKK